MRFTDIHERWTEKRLTQVEAASLLGMCERTFRRYCRKHETEQMDALYDKRPAYSPEARGRSERMFGTLQQRLPKELAFAGITSMDDANRFLKELYLPQHNQRFGVKPAQEDSALVAWLDSGMNLQDILCIQEQRTVSKDNTVSYKGKTSQIPKQQHRCHYIKAKVRVHEYQDGTLSLFHGPRKLVTFDHTGQPLETNQLKAA